MADDTYQAYRGALAATFAKNMFSSLQLIATSPAHQSLDALDATQSRISFSNKSSPDYWKVDYFLHLNLYCTHVSEYNLHIYMRPKSMN